MRVRAYAAPPPRAWSSVDTVALVCALVVFVAAAILSKSLFGGIPHVQDSIAQLFQARIFAEGRVWAPSLPLREAFDYAHLINDGRWYAQYPPGHALLLVPGVWLGAPWLVNPILGALSIYAIFLLGREVQGRAIGRLAAVLGVLSPFLLLMAAEYMAHVGALCALTMFLTFHLRMVRTGQTRDGILAGLCLLAAILIRPYTALAMAGPVAVHAALWCRCDLGSRWRPMTAFVAGGAVGAALLGLYNLLTTGDALVPGYIRLYGASHGLGFGKGSWGPPHTLARGLSHAGQNVVALNGRLFEWPLSSLWPLLVALVPGGRSRDRDGENGRAGASWLLLAVAAALLIAHIFYWFHDLCFGPRYLYEALGPLLVLSAVGLWRIAGWLPRLGRRRTVGVAGLLAVLSLAAGLSGWPRLFRTPPEAAGAAAGSGPRMASYFQHYGREYWGVSPYLGERVDREVTEPQALVICRFAEFQPEGLQFRHLWFGSAFAHQAPDAARPGVLYAQDRGEEANRRLAEAYPDRAIYLYHGTIERGDLIRVRASRAGL